MNKNLVLFISFFLVFSLSVSGCLKEENDNENNININDETKTEGNIWIMDIDGSNKTQLTFDSYVQSYPSISLDGKSIIFWAYYNNNPSIWTMTLDGKDQKKLLDYGYNPRFSIDGENISFINNNEITILNNNGSVNKITNFYSENKVMAFYPSFAFNDSKILFQKSSVDSGDNDSIAIILLDLNTGIETTIMSYGEYPNISPDNKWILFHNEYSICKYEIDTKEKISLTNNEFNSFPMFSKNGDKIVYCSKANGSPNKDIWVMNSDGSGKKQLTVDNEYDYTYPSFSPDGKKILYVK